ncbi:MAG: FliI/YscN family ATPase [bacterium]
MGLSKYIDIIKRIDPVRVHGKISRVIGLIIESTGPSAAIGELCRIEFGGILVSMAEVVGFHDNKTLLMPLGLLEGIRPGFDVIVTREPLKINVGDELLGRIIDGMGKPLDDKGPINCAGSRPVTCQAPHALTRKRISKRMETGIRSIDAFCTIGRGQRVGIFSGSGVGKSVLLGMVARHCLADINVIALIGERGREVREFIEKDLGEDGLKRSVVVVATADQPAVLRIKGAMVATTIAEHFRDKGKDVMFMLDSATRIAMAQREIGLAIGEPPASKGYTPSVFSLLPRLIERAGTSDKGTITGIYTVLVEGDDLDEPISDAMRAILDGHIVLDRALANKNHYPAVDVLKSISRVMREVTDIKHQKACAELSSIMAAYQGAEDLINIGAYARGSSAEIDRAIELIKPLSVFLKQDINDKTDFNKIIAALSKLSGIET